ncbi:putative DNA repair protein [Leptomonas pyrrhocoris]|uniref:Putative DNA repair protein n=1 Tax=Leptomonas pyrrhocoris TaxID=157538 RepID=A0A0M9FS36_LEPPY|nr:putative DNA repair protein [Leptomonas pyrrhocoris]XP_015653227.1 putative DNA repair protein [Leptomonas pyrrhocoris]XP_015653228.1 putative DNA repair protein [Leptomonas pyrrhocoris]KPA74787.1 putative DNA repair protein [Leptomonas pyrrhocoris]KPA74788.1 putative DNA repair protein [Leptomonas pyrrhocoris]KPA74789.1 putative DNA repair protein [Leptomonas pyrrhocoris]|eukprot:XP_015653226.1 putative DNA repair protein [Leptomonas pyrrhocoris]
MMTDNSDAAKLLSETQTCSRFIAAVSAREMPDNHNVQICVLSVGFDVEGVVAALLLQQRMRQRSRRVYCVVVPENLPPGSVRRMAMAIERHLQRKETESATGLEATRAANESGGPDAPSSSLAKSASPSTSVVAIEEGTGTKERCTVFQRGAVVLLTSRSLCADLLHRRLAVGLVGMAILMLPHAFLGGGRVQDALAPQTAFCAELLLRGGAMHIAGVTGTEPRAAVPPVVVLSDAPMLMRSLVQRHHIGTERFVQQLHVGDIQLFPRFRLDFVRHFEALSRHDNPRGRPLEVDRIVAPVSPSVLALDGLLAKIVLETLQELQRLEQQQQQQQRDESSGVDLSTGSNKGNTNWSPAARRAAAAADADEDVGAQRFLPRARFTATASNGHVDYSGYPRSSANRGEASASSAYVRQGWRAAKDGKGIWFNGISEAAALAVDFSDLDSDLRTVVRRHEPQWPFRALTESLIDVRRLRRATRGTAFSFLLQLECVLEKRQPQRSVYGTAARPPAALWTLSSSFHDVVTVATHRIGTVVYPSVATGSNGGAAPRSKRPPSPAEAATVVVVDSGSSDGDDVRAVQPADGDRSAPTAQAPQLMPNTEEQDADVEVVVRLAMSWCRTVLRRRAPRRQSSASVVVTPVAPPKDALTAASELLHADAPRKRSASRFPTLLLLTFGAGAVVRYTERLTHDCDTYQQLQLRRFMQIYQAKYGVTLQEYTTTAAAAKENEGGARGRNAEGEASAVAVEEEEQQQELTASLFATVGLDEADSEEESGEGTTSATDGDDDGEEGGLARLHRKLLQQRSAASTGGGSTSATQAGPSSLYGEGDAGGGGARAFHQALLSQMPPLPTQNTSTDAATAAASTKSLKDGVERRLDEEGSSSNNDRGPPVRVDAPPSSALQRAPLLFSVERVRAGAVTLRPLLDEAEEGVAAETHIVSTDDVPRVLVLDGGQLSATELTMLLDGSHAALAFDVPTTPTECLGRMTSADGGDGAPAAEARLEVQRVIVTSQRLSVLRQLEMAQDELPAACLRRLKVQLITTSLADADFKKTVQAEQLAFESLAHTKATLTGTLLVDQSSLRQTEEALESGLLMARRRGIVRHGSTVARLSGRFYTDRSTTATCASPPCVIFDEREFRSTLPYHLFRRGVDLVPLTLTTADYVLSPEYAVERKSVLDYLQSVLSGRIQHQLAALSRKYSHPLCLIEFHRGIPFRLLQSRIYGRTAKLMANYPRVSYVWARSPAHAAGMLVTLKKSVATANADPSDPSLTGSAMNPGSAGEAGGLAASAAEREAAHYAARVLSRFPGIHHQNAPRVMQLCGSLIGLATISQSSLATVMDAEDAARLYDFLHTPFHERVD